MATSLLHDGSPFTGVVRRVFSKPSNVQATCGAIAVTCDGAYLLVPDVTSTLDDVDDDVSSSEVIHIIRTSDGVIVRDIATVDLAGEACALGAPQQVSITDKGFCAITDTLYDGIVVLTPDMQYYGSFGLSVMSNACGVCANDEIVVVALDSTTCLQVYRMHTWEFMHGFAPHGTGDGEVFGAGALCFMSAGRHVAVAELCDRVSVFRITGEFERHVGSGILKRPAGVACSHADELIVADRGNNRVVLFDADGAVCHVLGADFGSFCGVALHNKTIFAQTNDGRCVVFE